MSQRVEGGWGYLVSYRWPLREQFSRKGSRTKLNCSGLKISDWPERKQNTFFVCFVCLFTEV